MVCAPLLLPFGSQRHFHNVPYMSYGTGTRKAHPIQGLDQKHTNRHACVLLNAHMLTRGVHAFFNSRNINSNSSRSLGPATSRQQTPPARPHRFRTIEITAAKTAGSWRHLLGTQVRNSAPNTAAEGARFLSGSLSSSSSLGPGLSSRNSRSSSSSRSSSTKSKNCSATRPLSRHASSSSSSGSSGTEQQQGSLERQRIFEAEVSETGASSAIAPGAEGDIEAEAEGFGGRMDPQHRQTVEVVEVDVIEGENGEPGNSMVGTVAGSAAGAALAGGLAAAAALSAPLAVAAAAVGAMVGAVAGGAVGKEVPRGVDVDSAMEFDQPAVVRAGQEADEQEALAETVWDSATAPPPPQGSPLAGGGGGAAGGGDAPEAFHGRPTLGEHEIADVKPERQS